jgi:23S rRNA (adenine2503-C2)-methyltransferase
MTAAVLASPPVASPLRLAGATRAEIARALVEIGVPDRELRMRAGQLWHWIYHRGVRDFGAMRNVSRALLDRVAERCTLERPEVAGEQVSADGTRKWLLRMPSTGRGDRGAEIECVYIPESDRGTLCVSSQVGCTLNCRFCHTGTQALVRNLTAAEIVAQVQIARDDLGEWPSDRAERRLSNIVFMGMGEPLYNLDNVAEAIDIVSDNEGLGISRRRITVSTAGVVPQIEALGARTQAMLAISLHATNDVLRDELVPLNKRYPLAELIAAIRVYPGLSNARRVTFEYVMLKGVNDTPAEALALVRLLAGIPAKINLIPFNPWPGASYECSDWATIEAFAAILNRAGYASPIRTPRGRDILAACGQLRTESLKVRASDARKATSHVA